MGAGDWSIALFRRRNGIPNIAGACGECANNSNVVRLHHVCFCWKLPIYQRFWRSIHAADYLVHTDIFLRTYLCPFPLQNDAWNGGRSIAPDREPLEMVVQAFSSRHFLVRGLYADGLDVYGYGRNCPLWCMPNRSDTCKPDRRGLSYSVCLSGVAGCLFCAGLTPDR